MCAQCGQDISQIPTTSIAGDTASEELTTLIWAAIGLGDAVTPMGFQEPGVSKKGAAFLPAALKLPRKHSLHGMLPATVLEYFRRMTLMLMRYDRHNPLFAQALAPIGGIWSPPPRGHIAWKYRSGGLTTHGALVAMWQILRDWPTKWHEALDRIAQEEMRHNHTGKRFPVMVAEEFPGPRWAWLREGIHGYLKKGVQSKIYLYPWLPYYRTAQRASGRLVPLLTLKETAQELGLSMSIVSQYIKEGRVRATPSTGKGHRREWRLVDKESIDELKERQGGLFTLTETAKQFGIGENSLVALIAAGMLKAERGPLIGKGAVWLFEGEEASTSLHRILDAFQPRSSRGVDGATMLPKALRISSWRSVAFPHLVTAVRDRELRGYFDSSADAEGLQRVWFERQELLAWLKRREQPEGINLLTVQEVRIILGCKTETLQRLYRNGLLMPVQDETGRDAVRWRYDSRALEEFRTRYVFSDVIAIDLSTTALTVQKWAKSGRLPIVSGPGVDDGHAYIFDRKAIAEWRRERLTPGEVMSLLGISKATISRWTLDGKLQPINDMGGKQRWYSRADVERLMQH